MALPSARPDAHPLRRARASRRRAADLRQHHAGLAADRRGVAAAAASAQRAAHADRSHVSDRRVGRRDLRRVLRHRHGRDRMDRVRAHRISGGVRRSGGSVRAEPQHRLSAVDAADRAAAARDDDSGGGDVDGVVRAWADTWVGPYRSRCGTVGPACRYCRGGPVCPPANCRRGLCARVSDTLRGVAADGDRAGHRRVAAVAERRRAQGRVARHRRDRALPCHRHRRFHDLQSRRGRPVVRRRRFFRPREQGARRLVARGERDRMGRGATERQGAHVDRRRRPCDRGSYEVHGTLA